MEEVLGLPVPGGYAPGFSMAPDSDGPGLLENGPDRGSEQGPCL